LRCHRSNIFKPDFSKLWQAGSLQLAFSKAATTSWIWNLLCDAHDFEAGGSRSRADGRRIYFASNIAHIALVLLWIGAAFFHGAYFSNYSSWLKDPTHILPSAQIVYDSGFGQSNLNSDVGGYFQGIVITSGIFQLWLSESLTNVLSSK